MSLNKKTLFIIISSLAVLLLAALIYFFLAGKNPLSINQSGGNLNQAADNAKTEIAQEKIAYDNYQKQMAIVYAKNIDSCLTLGEADEINECVMAIASQSKRKDYCDKIIKDDRLKTECLDSIDFINISWGADPNLCDTLADPALKENCYEEYFVKLDNPSQCEIVKDGTRKSHCQELVNNRLKSLADAKATIKDSDNDGLSDEVEISFGTNPFKADTDGDGVSDYEEINKYHTNPRVYNVSSDFKK